METPLCKLAQKYGTDKCPQLKHSYTPHYYEMFKGKQDKIKKVFEMGIGYYPNIQMIDKTYDKRLKRTYHKGASLKMWRDFFPNAQIYGADIMEASLFKDNRIDTIQCDQTNEESIRRAVEWSGPDIDLFVDDGSHFPPDQVVLARTILPLLNKDVLYIIEDVYGLDYVRGRLRHGYTCEAIEGRKGRADDRLVIVKKL